MHHHYYYNYIFAYETNTAPIAANDLLDTDMSGADKSSRSSLRGCEKK